MTNKGFGFCEECDTPCDFIKKQEMMITYEGYYDRDVAPQVITTWTFFAEEAETKLNYIVFFAGVTTSRKAFL